MLREYQHNGVSGVRDAMRAGQRRVILYSPTGSGKTEIAMHIIESAIAKGKSVVFCCNRIGLVQQTSRRFFKSGISHGILQGQNTTRSYEKVIVASIQTVAKRGLPLGIDLLVIDEAHGAVAEAYRTVIATAKCPVIGLTATPFAKGMGRHNDEIGGPLFESIQVAATIPELIELGFLVDCDIYAPSTPNLQGVKITAGDYNEKQLGERVNNNELVGDIVEHWQRLAGGQTTVCFATNIAHSQHITEKFNAAGIQAEHIDCFTEDDDRTAILGRLTRGETKVVSNVSVLAEGWDCPAVSCMILARPTRSLIRYIQMCGRALRPYEGKVKALILDHSGSCAHLGFPTEDLPLELDDGKKPKPSAAEEEARVEKLPRACTNCKYMIPVGVYACPACGHEAKRPNKVASKAGELVKLKKATPDEKQRVYAELAAEQERRGYADGWTSHKYKEWFGVWPRGVERKGDVPMSPDVKNFIKSNAIRYAKRIAKMGVTANV